jgi:hypothetical protein
LTLAFTIAVFGQAAIAFAQMSVEVVALKYRTAEEVIPVLQPILAREGSISGLRGQLVVRTTPANFRELRQVLDSIDVAPRRLLVTVAQDISGEGSRRGADISGSLRTDDRLRLTVPRSTAPQVREQGVNAHIYDSRSVDSVHVLQTLQVLEGRSAFIQVGSSAPLGERRVVRSVVNGRVVDQVVDGVDYREAATGFHVTPRIAADRVILEISPQREAFVQRAPGIVDIQRVTSTVSGALGEWIELASVSQERQSERDVLLGRGGGQRSESRSLLVKVEELR